MRRVTSVEGLLAAPDIGSLALVLNTSAGLLAAGSRFAGVESRLEGARIERVRTGLDATGLASRAVQDGARTVVAAGGDGTVRAVAQAVAGTQATLGIIPAGTLNHLARELRIPLALNDAVSVIRTGRVRQIDAGEVNGRLFVNNAVLGLYTAYRAERTGEERRGSPRVVATAAAALRILSRNPVLRFRILLDGGRELLRYSPLVLVANNENRMEGHELGVRDRLDAGRLWIYVLRPRTRAGLLATGLRVVAGRLRKRRAFEVFAAAEAVIETGRTRIPLALDGELMELDSPLHFRSRPRALRVIVPRGGAGRSS